MKVKMLRDARPFGRTGEIVEVSPSGFDYVTSLGIAVPVTEARERAEVPDVPVEIKAPAEKAKKPAAKAEEKKQAKPVKRK